MKFSNELVFALSVILDFSQVVWKLFFFLEKSKILDANKV
jgi:hypothetical protein